ncbi:MAG: AtpZ/AtpI family protein [Desulfovibrio sp.]|nr:MAG: AtpZ/AtpI family protein [Desulfovibrio sp.]
MKFFKDFRLGLDKEYRKALATAAVIGLHLLSGLLVGLGLYYLLGLFMEKKPWILVTLVVVGLAAGINNVIKDTKLLLKEVKEGDEAKLGADPGKESEKDKEDPDNAE